MIIWVKSIVIMTLTRLRRSLKFKIEETVPLQNHFEV